MRYRCKKCGAVADIDVENRRMVIEARPPEIPSRPGVNQYAFSFPTHPDCELAKPVDKINLNELEKVGLEEIDYVFAHERGAVR